MQGTKRLFVYEKSLEFYRAALRVARSLERRDRRLADQLQRAAASIVLNIAEGSGEFAVREKARIYRIALRSARECAAIVELAEIQHPSPLCAEATTRVDELISLLVLLLRSVTQGKRS